MNWDSLLEKFQIWDKRFGFCAIRITWCRLPLRRGYYFGQETYLQLRNMTRNKFIDQSAGNTPSRRGTWEPGLPFSQLIFKDTFSIYFYCIHGVIFFIDLRIPLFINNIHASLWSTFLTVTPTYPLFMVILKPLASNGEKLTLDHESFRIPLCSLFLRSPPF